MHARASHLGRPIVGSSLSALLAIAACGGSSSSILQSSSDGGSGAVSSGGAGGSLASSGASSSGGGAADDASLSASSADGSLGGQSSGSSNGSIGASSGGIFGFGSSSGGAVGVASTCIIGTQGCLCDTTGGCAPGFTCTPQASPLPNLCCNGSNCAPTTGASVGATCGGTSASGASCTPGITIAPATNGNDSCGYPATSFAESTTLCAITAAGGGAQPAVVEVFYNDEHALTLGCATATYPVSSMTSDPGAAHYPQTGDPACLDAVGRPLRPVLYVTDITGDPSCTAGDLQHGGTPYNPVAVFGTWKSAIEGDGGVGVPTADPTANHWNLTSSADPVPYASFTSSSPMPMPMPMGCNEAYGAELRFEVGMVWGHSYRLQVVVHDGDQNKGGDSGEACAVFCAGGAGACPPGVMACDGDSGSCPQGTVCTQGCCAAPTQPESPGDSGMAADTATQSSPSDGSADTASDATAPSADATRCALYGQQCTTNADCCNGVPCSSGLCASP